MRTACCISASALSLRCRSEVSISSACNSGSRRLAAWTARRRRRKSRPDARAATAGVLRMVGDGISAHGRRRFRHHGAKTHGRWRTRASLQYAADRRHSRCLDLDTQPAIGRALQPGCEYWIRLAERAAVVRGVDLHRSASARWPRRRVGSASHVRTACVAVQTSSCALAEEKLASDTTQAIAAAMLATDFMLYPRYHGRLR